jgi:glutaconate CoA-transferase subunit B
MTAWSETEMMVVAAARRLVGERVCFVGIGLPNIACALAKRTVNPDLELLYESGVFGADPARLPLSIGDPALASGSIAITGMLQLFGFYLQGGRVDVAFLGAAQIDPAGNINTTVIGDYSSPTVRLPGSGGACEIGINAKKVFVIMRQSVRSFVPAVDFVTTAGQPERGRHSSRWGAGPTVVVTQLGVFRFVDGTMQLDSMHPGVALEAVQDACGWGMVLPARIGETPPPTQAELTAVRSLDPAAVYL